MYPLVSIIIPVYNSARFIEQAANSVLQQTYKNIEVIVIDDGSTDNTNQKVRGMQNNRIKLITFERNRGANYARNVGLLKSVGELIAFLDADDEWYPTKLEKQVVILSNLPLDFGMVYCGIIEVKEDSTRIEYPPVFRGNIFIPLLKECFEGAGSIFLCRKSCFEKEKWDELLPRHQDWDIFLRISKKYKADYVNECLVLKRSIPKDFSDKIIISKKIMLNKFSTDISELPLKLRSQIYANHWVEIFLSLEKIKTEITFNLNNSFNALDCIKWKNSIEAYFYKSKAWWKVAKHYLYHGKDKLALNIFKRYWFYILFIDFSLGDIKMLIKLLIVSTKK